MDFRDVTVILSQNVLIFVSNTSQLIGLVHFIIKVWNYFGLLEEIGIKSSVAFLKCFSIFTCIIRSSRTCSNQAKIKNDIMQNAISLTCYTVVSYKALFRLFIYKKSAVYLSVYGVRFKHKDWGPWLKVWQCTLVRIIMVWMGKSWKNVFNA